MTDVRVRLDALALEYSLPKAAPGRLGVLLERIAADERAPTAVRDAEEGVDAHVADSLVALTLPEVSSALSIVDLGAGAGLPSLVLAAALPDAQVVAVESAQKKAAFIGETAVAMGLTNLDVAAVRAEEWVAPPGGCDVVTARALAALPVLVEYAAPLLRMGGSLVAWKGQRDEDEEAHGDRAALEVGLERERIVPVRPFSAARDRRLYLYLKVASTPNRYPRRPGMARKRPLGA